MTKLIEENPEFTMYDDYQGQAYNSEHDPRLSKHFGPLVADLLSGKTVIVSDIVYCLPKELGVFIGAILSVTPNVTLDFRYFNNDPDQCRKNVITRSRPDRVERELELIDKLTKHYEIPSATSLAVYVDNSE